MSDKSVAEVRMLIFNSLTRDGVSSHQIKEKTGLTIEQIATQLPRLRAAGLVDSWKSGRQTLHHSVPESRSQDIESRVNALIRKPF